MAVNGAAASCTCLTPDVRICILVRKLTPVPPPASPCVRVRLDYTQGDTFLAGSRFYLSYAGSAPTPGNCAALATAIGNAWNTDLASLVTSEFGLAEVDVLDIATDTGNSGQALVNYPGTRSGQGLPAQCAMNIEFGIARRYRGGKPRMFLPGGTTGDLLNPGKFSAAYINDVAAGIEAFFTAIEGESIGAMGALAHVNLSYYSGFKNITNSSGRERAVPQYRAAALVDAINGYFPKAVIGSQRRRRAATTY